MSLYSSVHITPLPLGHSPSIQLQLNYSNYPTYFQDSLVETGGSCVYTQKEQTNKTTLGQCVSEFMSPRSQFMNIKAPGRQGHRHAFEALALWALRGGREKAGLPEEGGAPPCSQGGPGVRAQV